MLRGRRRPVAPARLRRLRLCSADSAFCSARRARLSELEVRFRLGDRVLARFERPHRFSAACCSCSTSAWRRVSVRWISSSVFARSSISASRAGDALLDALDRGPRFSMSRSRAERAVETYSGSGADGAGALAAPRLRRSLRSRCSTSVCVELSACSRSATACSRCSSKCSRCLASSEAVAKSALPRRALARALRAPRPGSRRPGSCRKRRSEPRTPPRGPRARVHALRVRAPPRPGALSAPREAPPAGPRDVRDRRRARRARPPVAATASPSVEASPRNRSSSDSRSCSAVELSSSSFRPSAWSASASPAPPRAARDRPRARRARLPSRPRLRPRLDASLRNRRALTHALQGRRALVELLPGLLLVGLCLRQLLRRAARDRPPSRRARGARVQLCPSGVVGSGPVERFLSLLPRSASPSSSAPRAPSSFSRRARSCSAAASLAARFSSFGPSSLLGDLCLERREPIALGAEQADASGPGGARGAPACAAPGLARAPAPRSCAPVRAGSASAPRAPDPARRGAACLPACGRATGWPLRARHYTSRRIREERLRSNDLGGARVQGSVERIAVAVAAVGLLVVATGSAGTVIATPISTDPYTNTSSYHADAGRARHVLVRDHDRRRVPDRPLHRRRGVEHRLGDLDRQRRRPGRPASCPATTVYASPPGRGTRISDPAVAYDPEHDVWMISSLAHRRRHAAAHGGHRRAAPPTAGSPGRTPSPSSLDPARSTTRTGSPATRGRPARIYGNCYVGVGRHRRRATADDEHVDRRRPDVGPGHTPERRPSGSAASRSPSRTAPCRARIDGQRRHPSRSVSTDGGTTCTARRRRRERQRARRRRAACGPSPLPSAEVDGGGQGLRRVAGLPVPRRAAPRTTSC